MRFSLVSAAVLVAASASAQIPNVTKFRVTAGYGFSNRFDDKNGNGVTMNGPVLGLEMPIMSALKFDASVGATWFGGGRLSHGDDADGDVYRFMALARTEIPGTGFFAKGGVGYSFMTGRGNVGDEKGAILQLGVQVPLVKGYAQRVVPMVDAYYVAGKGGLGGFVVGLTFSF